MSTTLEKEKVRAFKDSVDSFSRMLDSFVQAIPQTQEQDNLMLNEIPQTPEDMQISYKQKRLLLDLINQRCSNKAERERWYAELEVMSKFDASELISSFLIGAR